MVIILHAINVQIIVFSVHHLKYAPNAKKTPFLIKNKEYAIFVTDIVKLVRILMPVYLVKMSYLSLI